MADSEFYEGRQKNFAKAGNDLIFHRSGTADGRWDDTASLKSAGYEAIALKLLQGSHSYSFIYLRNHSGRS